MFMNFAKLARIGAVASVVTLVAACGGGGNSVVPPPVPPPAPPPPVMATFAVTITNLTLAQPLSPPAVLFHGAAYSAFEDGVVASNAIEVIAEDGDRQALVDEATADAAFIAAGDAEGPIGPLMVGPTDEISFLESQVSDLRLTMVTMLVHTNDAFTGVNSVDLSGMAVGESRTFSGPTWDAGTEANSENAATIPGPDFGGVGFDAARDDIIDRVRFHQGVVTRASLESGQADSALVERHRFDNPTSRMTVTRTE